MSLATSQGFTLELQVSGGSNGRREWEEGQEAPKPGRSQQEEHAKGWFRPSRLKHESQQAQQWQHARGRSCTEKTRQHRYLAVMTICCSGAGSHRQAESVETGLVPA